MTPDRKAGLLAHVLVSKFADHLPLYRQSEIYSHQGVAIERSTLAGWVGGASDLLSPLVDAIQKHVLAGKKLTRRRHADAGACAWQWQDGPALDVCAR